MDSLIKNIAVDWEWVEKHLSARERIDKIGAGIARDEALKSLKAALDIARSKAAVRISLVKKAITGFHPESFELEGGIHLATKELARHMKGATHIYAFVTTVDGEIEEAATSYMNSGDHLLGYLLDRIGSFAVESLAKNIEESLRRELAAKDLSVSMRFSPGYCDWRLEEQFKLAQVIDFGKAGVTLTKNCMMVPKKSISAVVGIGPKGLFKDIKSPCAVCNMKVCDYRRND